VSEQLDSTHVEPLDPPLHHRRGRRTGLVAVLLLAVIVAAVVIVVGRPSGSAPDRLQPGASPSPVAQSGAAQARLAAVRELLRRRSAAVVHHDRAAFLATVDPTAATFRQREATMFANLARVTFASWSYTVGPSSARLGARRRRHYDAPTWAPAEFTLRYRIAGFDTHPTALPQYPTFVSRAGRWYLASLSDFRRRGDISATDLWDYAPVHVIRRHSVLVLGPRSQLGTMVEVAGQVEAAIPQVTAVWGAHWARRVVVLVPSSQREMGRIDADRGDLDQIAALTSSEVSSVNGRPAPVGDRVTINPLNWPKLGRIGAAVVLAHELTHVASRADTGSQTPKWLSEGFADYVGFRDADVAVTVAAAELATDVRAGRLPKRLPSDHAFRGANKALPQVYEASWLACRYIATRYGQPALVRFYRAVGTSRQTTSVAVATALHRVLGLTRRRFVARWRGYVHAQLA
jgi:hypothetical protein